MKALIIALLLFNHSLIWANTTEKQELDELGRSLANYQVCSEIAVIIKDELMFSYYQGMFNDARLHLLTKKAERSKQVYSSWQRSEKVLLKIGEDNLQQVCLSRFDELTRKIQKNSRT